MNLDHSLITYVICIQALSFFTTAYVLVWIRLVVYFLWQNCIKILPISHLGFEIPLINLGIVNEWRSHVVMVGGGLVGGVVLVSAELACEGWWEWIRQWIVADYGLLNWAKEGSKRVGSEQYYFVWKSSYIAEFHWGIEKYRISQK